MTPVDVAIAVGVFCVTLVNVALIYAILQQRLRERAPAEAPRKIEIIVRSAFMGEVLQEERMLVDALSDDGLIPGAVHWVSGRSDSCSVPPPMGQRATHQPCQASTPQARKQQRASGQRAHGKQTLSQLPAYMWPSASPERANTCA
jgi:hypothetical protein